MTDYIVDGYFNDLHEQGSFRQNYPWDIEFLSFLVESRPEFGWIVLAPTVSSRPLTDIFPGQCVSTI